MFLSRVNLIYNLEPCILLGFWVLFLIFTRQSLSDLHQYDEYLELLLLLLLLHILICSLLLELHLINLKVIVILILISF